MGKSYIMILLAEAQAPKLGGWQIIYSICVAWVALLLSLALTEAVHTEVQTVGSDTSFFSIFWTTSILVLIIVELT